VRWQYGGSGRADRDKQRHGLAVMGVPQEQIDAMLPVAAEGGVQLFPLALPVWQVWQEMGPRWRYVESVPQGLDVVQLESLYRQHGTRRAQQREWWPLLHAMEREALDLLRRKGN